MTTFLKTGFVACLITGCSWGSPTFEDRSPVKSLGNGEYIYYFKYTDGCLTDEQIKSCARSQLTKKSLIPTECINGIEVLSGKGPANGWVYAKFRCKNELNQ